MEPAVFTVLAGLVTLVFGDVSVLADNFYRVRICHYPVSSPQVSTKSIGSKYYCASLCVRDTACFSFSIEDDTGLCYFNNELLTHENCRNEYHHYNSIMHETETDCQHDGIYDSTTATCTCFNSYVGSRCQRLMTDCNDGYRSGHYTGVKDVFTIHPTHSPYSFKVYCEMEYGGEMFIMRQEQPSPSVNFNRSWSEYRDGFGNLTGNFWLGLEKIHYITTSWNFMLIVEAVLCETDPSITQGNYRQHFYSSFRVYSEILQFRFYTSNPSAGNGIHALGDCMTSSNGLPFSTYDNDVTRVVNCPATSMSGWWFKDCGTCNPTGILQPSSDTTVNPDPKYAHWPVPLSEPLVVRYLRFFLKISP